MHYFGVLKSPNTKNIIQLYNTKQRLNKWDHEVANYNLLLVFEKSIQNVLIISFLECCRQLKSNRRYYSRNFVKLLVEKKPLDLDKFMLLTFQLTLLWLTVIMRIYYYCFLCKCRLPCLWTRLIVHIIVNLSQVALSSILYVQEVLSQDF